MAGMRRAQLALLDGEFNRSIPLRIKAYFHIYNGRSSLVIGNGRHLAMPWLLVSSVNAVGGGANIRLT